MANTLTIDGRLRGMGCQVKCRLTTTLNDAFRYPQPIYMHCAIVDAPEWLPDGYYEVTFESQSAFVRRDGGCWTIGIPWPQEHAPLCRAA